MPGWYGMASVKWLTASRRWHKPYQGFQQVGGYHYRSAPGGPGTPVTHMRVKSLLVPPGIPDWYTRQPPGGCGPDRRVRSRLVRRRRADRARGGRHRRRTGRTAKLDPPHGQVCLARLARVVASRKPGEHELSCRATDAKGETQPLEPRWDAGGFGNNAVQRVRVTVR